MINDVAPWLLKKRAIFNLKENQVDQVLSWICGSRVGTILEQMFFEADDESLQAEFSLAIEQVKFLRNQPPD
jgi:hypothetical protein